MLDAAQQLILSNALALAGAALLVVQLVQREREDMFRVRCVSMGIMVAVFLIMACWSAAITSIFSLVLSQYEAYCHSPKNSVRVALCALSAVVAAMVQYQAGSLDLLTALPVVSAALTGFGFCFSLTAGAMRFVQGCDSCLWLVYDTCQLLFVNVFCDLLGVGMAVAYWYVQRFDPEDGFWQRYARE